MPDLNSLQEIEKVEKPWGFELIWAKTDRYVGKILHVKKGHKLSLQYHNKKVETIFLQSGMMSLQIDDSNDQLIEVKLMPGQAHHIPAGKRHRMIAIEDCDIFEVSTPELNDIVRLEDTYGRVS